MLELLNNWGTDVCTLCIKMLRFMEQETGMSYGLINVLIFIIAQPLLVVWYYIAAQLAWSRKTKASKILSVSGGLLILLFMLYLLRIYLLVS